MTNDFKYLFTPIAIRQRVAKNRIVSTGHYTGFGILPMGYAPSEARPAKEEE